jgi:hypothetical protein
MKIRPFLFAAGLSGILCGACKSPEPEDPRTVREIMASVVDPSAEVLFNSVSSSVTPQGVEEKSPQTEAEWAELRRRAMSIIEAGDLIVTPGRHVAKPGQQAKNPQVQLDPIEIESLIASERASWLKMAKDMQDSMQPMLKAIDAKNPAALSDSSIAIDEACEACHHKFWYPDSK